MAPAMTAMALSTITMAPTPTPAPMFVRQATNTSSSAAAPYCVAFQDPDQGVDGYCVCGPNGADGDFSFASGGDVCPYTSPAPASLTVAPTTPTSSAAPVPTGCQSGLNPDELCWYGLDLTTYVNDWWNDNQDDCASYDGFANCWYAKMTPYAPSTCDQLNTDPACTQPLWKDFSGDADNGAKNFYVSWALWNTQGFFLDLYNSIGDSSQTLSSNIGAIVLAMDPPDEGSSKWEYVFDALTFGLSLYSEGSILVKALLRSAPQSSTLFNKLLFPAGSLEGEISAWADVAQEVGNFTSLWQKSVGEGLPDIVNDVATFTGFCEKSPITGERPSLDGLTSSVSQSVGAYVISAIINQLDFVVTRAANLDVANLQQTETLWWDTGCGDGYDGNGICDSFYFDGTDTYSLVNPHGFKEMQTDYSDLLQQLIGGSNPLTTGELLFTNGYQCTASCGSNGGCEPGLDDPSNPPTCLSTIRVCTWTWDTFGPFEDGCLNLPDSNAVLPYFGVDPCIGSDGFGDTSVPHSYLGGGVLKDNAPGVWADELVCNSGY